MWRRLLILCSLLLGWKLVSAVARLWLGENGATLVAYLWVLGVTLAWIRVRSISLPRLVGGFEPRDLAVGPAAGLALFVLGIVGYVIAQRLTGLGLSSDAEAFFSAGSALDWVLVGSVTVVAVVGEEIAFRGILLDDLATELPTAAAILGSAALFALFHLSGLQTLSTFVLGVGLAWLTVSAGRLAPALLAHGTYNLLGLLMFVVARPAGS